MSLPDLKKSSMAPEPSQKRPDRLGLQGPWLIYKCFLQPSGISPPGSQLLTHRPLLLSLLPVCFCFAYCPSFFSSLHSQHLHSAQLGLNPNHLLRLSEDLNQEAFLDLLKQGMCPPPCTPMQPSTVLHCVHSWHSYTTLFTDTQIMMHSYSSLCPKYLTLPGTHLFGLSNGWVRKFFPLKFFIYQASALISLTFLRDKMHNLPSKAWNVPDSASRPHLCAWDSGTTQHRVARSNSIAIQSC